MLPLLANNTTRGHGEPVPRTLALLGDYPEEDWPSMNLCEEMLRAESQALAETGMRAVGLRPAFRSCFTRLPILGQRRGTRNFDRLLNRYWFYPRFLARQASRFDAFHVVDHTYAALVHALPAERTGVYCHDLDAFRCLLEPARDPRPRWFRRLARHVLGGLQKAALVFHATTQVRQEILRHQLVDPDRLVAAPYGVAPEFLRERPGPESERFQARPPFLLHVGSCVPRKRIDLLLDVFAGVRPLVPGLRLVKVGTDWSSAQREQIGRLGLGEHIDAWNGLDRTALAALYQSATLVLVPSAAEGFGLPVIEALACGSLVIASDLPVFREVGGSAVVYCPEGDVMAWSVTVEQLLRDPSTAPPRADRLARGRLFSWTEHARRVGTAYRQLLSGTKTPADR